MPGWRGTSDRCTHWLGHSDRSRFPGGDFGLFWNVSQLVLIWRNGESSIWAEVEMACESFKHQMIGHQTSETLENKWLQNMCFLSTSLSGNVCCDSLASSTTNAPNSIDFTRHRARHVLQILALEEELLWLGMQHWTRTSLGNYSYNTYTTDLYRSKNPKVFVSSNVIKHGQRPWNGRPDDYIWTQILEQ